MLLLLLLNLSCNNSVETSMYENYLWTFCKMWLVMLNHVRSWFVYWFVWDPSWFHWTTGFVWAQVWRFDCFGDLYCTCVLRNWTVLLHSCIAFTQSTSFNASSILFGSMDDTNEKCSQNEANLYLVCTPLEISPMIVSNGWSLAILVGWRIGT